MKGGDIMRNSYSITVNFGKKTWERRDLGRRGVARTGSISRKTIPFLLSIQGLDEEESEELFVKWAEQSALLGAEAMADSEFDATWHEDERIMQVRVSYPKDFDSGENTEVQRNHLLSLFKHAASSVSHD